VVEASWACPKKGEFSIMPYPPITAERLAAYATLGLEGLLTEENKELLAEVIHLREQVAELTKCECGINTNWHEGVPYDYKVTCCHCDNQLAAAEAEVEQLKVRLDLANKAAIAMITDERLVKAEAEVVRLNKEIELLKAEQK